MGHSVNSAGSSEMNNLIVRNEKSEHEFAREEKGEKNLPLTEFVAKIKLDDSLFWSLKLFEKSPGRRIKTLFF